MYSIGKLSKNTGVTVRTLDYYDEIGLIKPSSKTSGGHRQYSEDDVMQLERVLALKYMGFTLEKIKDILKNSAPTWQQPFQQQLDMVRREQERLKNLEHALLGVSHSIEFERGINWSIIFGIIQKYQQDPDDALHDALQQYNHYLSEEEMKKIMDMNAQMSEEDIKDWVKIISDIKNNLEIDPGSEVAQDLVERWLNQAENIFGNDQELLGDMWEALQHLKEGIVFYPMDKDVIHFIEQVLTIKYADEEME